jgi:CubicO group peptidase (beta-lactamase class C family)
MPSRIDRREFAARTAATIAALLLGERRAAAASIPFRGVRQLASPGSAWMPREELLTEIPSLMELATVPGLAFAVVDGDHVTSYTFGLARRELLVDVGASTLFEAASLGKPLFAAAVLRLVDAGILDLDRPLSAYAALPEVTTPRARAITARHVLSHTTGLPNWRLEPGPLLPATDPGAQFSYSGEGVFYLQRILELVTGKSIEHLLREQVFDPVGMGQSTVVWLPESNAHMATGYDERGQALEVYADIGRKLAPLASAWKKPMSEWKYADEETATRTAFPELPTLPLYMVPNAAGSLLTTVTDYGHFLSAMLTDGPSPIALTPSTRKAMLTPQVKLNSKLSWGLGWGIEHDEQGDLIWHWGANGSFRNFVLADPRRRRGIVVLTNSANGPKLYERIITNITGRDHPAFLWFQV